jgi:hypothetical protein
MILAKDTSWDCKVLIRSTCPFRYAQRVQQMVKGKREADSGNVGEESYLLTFSKL